MIIDSVYIDGIWGSGRYYVFVCSVQFRNETSDVRRNYAAVVRENELFGNLLHFNIVYLSLWRETRLLV